MEKINVKVYNSTKSASSLAEFFPASGLIKFLSDPPEYSHISSEINKGKSVFGVVEEVEPVKEIAPEVKVISEPQSASPKSKKHRK